MFSRYLRSREKNGWIALFHELHPEPIYIPTIIWQRGLISEFLEKLQHQKLVISNADEDDVELEVALKKLKEKFIKPIILYLMTARGCNLNCSYCPVPGIAARKGESFLSIENAKKGIDLWVEHLKESAFSSEEYYVIFYGGEPLLNKAVIEPSIRYLQQLWDKNGYPKKLRFMTVTNGIFVDKEFAVMCREYNILVALGIDGPKEIHNQLRIYGNYEGTFDKVIASLKLFLSEGVEVCASTTITPQNIKNISSYADFFREMGVKKIGFNFLRGKALEGIGGERAIKEYAYQASRAVIENTRTGGLGFEYQMEKKINAFKRQDFFPVDCTCYGNQLVIQPDGQISNCPFSDNDLGHVMEVDKSFRITNAPIVEEWKRRLPLLDNSLVDFDAKSLYGGGCAWGSGELSNDFLAQDEIMKIFASEVFDEIIWSGFSQ